MQPVPKAHPEGPRSNNSMRSVRSSRQAVETRPTSFFFSHRGYIARSFEADSSASAIAASDSPARLRD